MKAYLAMMRPKVRRIFAREAKLLVAAISADGESAVGRSQSSLLTRDDGDLL